MINVLKTIVPLVLIATPASAGDWTSSDGCISVASPNSSRFTETESSPPISLSWESKDGSIILAIVEAEYPAGMKLRRTSLEASFAEIMRGKIVDSSIETCGGHEVVRMTAQSETPENGAYATVAVVAIDDRIYKLMATGIGVDTRNDPDVTEFISSLKMLKPKPVATVVASPESPNPQSESQQRQERATERLFQSFATRCIVLALTALSAVLFRNRRKRGD